MRFLLWCVAFGACAGEAPQEGPAPVRPGATLDAEAHYDRGVARAAQGRAAHRPAAAIPWRRRRRAWRQCLPCWGPR